MRRALFVALLAGVWIGSGAVARADKTAKSKKADKKADKKDKDSDSDSDSSDDSDSGDDSSDDATTTDDSDDSAPKKKGKAKASDESSDEAEPKTSNTLEAKQDLTGHDLGTKKQTNEFEKDRFFVDKVDTEKTEDATLIQGSLTSTSFIYHETGDKIGATGNTSGSPFSRMFTDLRLQTDFRHIKASRWEARFDGRLRFNSDPGVNSSGTAMNPYNPTLSTATQSGFNGANEYDLREFWLIRNGEQTDVIIGRQFIPDLGGLKIDGMRIDYASSQKVTLLGFGGLYPLRGSRSLTTDYTTPLANPGATMDPAGPVVGATGFGGAYRTPTTYGAVGGVALIPLKGEEARVYATSNGYWRYGSVLDVYHFALIDLVGSAGAQLTNLSAGVNIKPSPRLRMTASVNHVDTETLNIQANAFLMSGDLTNVVQNQVLINRLSTNEARGSISAGLGQNQRVEVTTAISYRLRPEFQLFSPTHVEEADLPAAKSVEVYGSITDRHSFKDARIGVDGLQTFATGNVPFQRTKFFAMRLFAAHEIKDGQGEWEADLSYSTSVDSGGGTCAASTDLSTCFGFTNGTVISLGGTAYYRFNRDWFGIASLYLTQTSLKEGGTMGMAPPADPDIIGASGLLRLAYRF